MDVKNDTISRQAAIKALNTEIIKRRLLDDVNDGMLDEFDTESILRALLPAEPEIAKEYDLKKIYNIYVKIAQAHFAYQPSNPKAITAMPFDWIEVQNLLEKYLEDHGADFDALCKGYVSENVKDDHLPSAQPEPAIPLSWIENHVN